MKKVMRSEKQRHKSLNILYFLGFVLNLSIAIPTYINSSFIEKFIALKWVSLFFIAASLTTIFILSFYPGLIKRFRNYQVAKIVLGLNAVGLLGLAFASSALSAFLFFILLNVSSVLLVINMDVFVESFSVDKSTGRTRAIYFTFLNLGWVAAPLITSYILKDGNYRTIYLLAFVFLLPFYFVFTKKSKNLTDKIKYSSESPSQSIKKIFKNKNLRGVFFLALLLFIFYSLAVVYVPVYLHNVMGFSWSTLGIMFSIMLLPFVLFEIPAGILADKKLGEKEIFYLGFSILIISLLLFFFLKTKSPFIWGAVLFFSRTGASLVEAMRESYFFKKVDAEDVGIINFFRTTQPLGYLSGTILAMIILNFLPVQYAFLIAAAILLSSFYFLYTIKDTK